MTPAEVQMAINMAEQGRNAEVARVLRAMIAGETAVATGDNAAIGALAADAEEEHALNSTFSDTEVEAALDALGAKINEIIAAIKG